MATWTVTFTVRRSGSSNDQPKAITVNASNEHEAIEKAKQRIGSGERNNAYGFSATRN